MAGGTALHFSPNSIRISRDFDSFHDSESLVAEAFARDREHSKMRDTKSRYGSVNPGSFGPPFLGRRSDTDRLAHDSAWRFMPVQTTSSAGTLLHEIYLATSKVLALASRTEPRDLGTYCMSPKAFFRLVLWSGQPLRRTSFDSRLRCTSACLPAALDGRTSHSRRLARLLQPAG